MTDTNEIITLDLKELDNGKYVLWFIDSFSKYLKGVVINNKKKETVLTSLYYDWICPMGIPSVGFWTDNGGEFQNNVMAEFVDKYGLVLKFGAAHSPWSNGINERNHAVADIIMGKVKEGDKSLTDQQAVNIASWSHNTNVNKLGYTHLQLQVGKSIGLPGFTEGTMVTNSKFKYELVEKLVMNMKKTVEQFRIANFREKI